MRNFVKKPYPISAASQIPSGVIGAFLLSRDGSNANYVGRSDEDLGSEIRKRAEALNAGYTHFFFEPADSPHDAFILECRWYHSYSFLENKEHPKPPHGMVLRCPFCRQILRGID